jgi:hypothetical protein
MFKIPEIKFLNEFQEIISQLFFTQNNHKNTYLNDFSGLADSYSASKNLKFLYILKSFVLFHDVCITEITSCSFQKNKFLRDC